MAIKFKDVNFVQHIKNTLTLYIARSLAGRREFFSLESLCAAGYTKNASGERHQKLLILRLEIETERLSQPAPSPRRRSLYIYASSVSLLACSLLLPLGFLFQICVWIATIQSIWMRLLWAAVNSPAGKFWHFSAWHLYLLPFPTPRYRRPIFLVALA